MQPPFKMILETDIEKWRYETWDTKEPETIAWIDDMSPGAVLYDVGANIGIYTLYAASRGVQVFAFEPALRNYLRLCENINLNGFDRACTVHMGAGKKSCPIGLFVPSLEIGASGSQCNGNGYTVAGISLNDFANAYGNPNYVKIDIDGLENDVVSGAHAIINSSEIKSFLIEVDTSYFSNCHNMAMHFCGRGPAEYTIKNKYNTMTPHSRERRQREGINAENVVFTRI